MGKLREGGGRCPGCGAAGRYVLGDGRSRCRRCGRKFTPHPHGNRIGPERLRRIALHFWLMVPAARAAREIGLERKTVQKYYRRLRQAIAEYGGWRAEDWLPDSSGGEPVPVFAVDTRERSLRVMAPASGAAGSGVLAESDRAWRDLDLVRWHPQGEAADRFWTFARPLLGRYRGRFRRAFPLYLKEMEFRFNHRRDGWAVSRLTRLLWMEGVPAPGSRRRDAR